MRTVVRTHSRNPLHRRRKRLPPKKRNEVAMNADYNRRVCTQGGKVKHNAAKKHSYKTYCLDCGVTMRWVQDRYYYG